MRVVCISDTHSFDHEIKVPDGDLLIHAGDLTYRGSENEVVAALDWLASLPHERKVFIAGNHDWFFDPNAPAVFHGWSLSRSRTVEGLLAAYPELTYLQDSGTRIGGLNVWGSPWQPFFGGWAFNFGQSERADGVAPDPVAIYARVPSDTDVLVTHGPPLGVLDMTALGQRVGSAALRLRLGELRRLRLHLFGHIHEGYGRLEIGSDATGKVALVNASICTAKYAPINEPIVVDL